MVFRIKADIDYCNIRLTPHIPDMLFQKIVPHFFRPIFLLRLHLHDRNKTMITGGTQLSCLNKKHLFHPIISLTLDILNNFQLLVGIAPKCGLSLSRSCGSPQRSCHYRWWEESWHLILLCFPIFKVVKLVSVCLQLPSTISIHSTFQVSWFKPVRTSRFDPSFRPPPPRWLIDGDPVYFVGYIQQ